MEPHYSHFASQRETQIDDENRKNFFREINPDTQKADGHNSVELQCNLENCNNLF